MPLCVQVRGFFSLTTAMSASSPISASLACDGKKRVIDTSVVGMLYVLMLLTFMYAFFLYGSFMMGRVE